MSTEHPLSESARGYLSPESKRRFTLVAGILGGAFFLAQTVLPFLAVLLFVFPMMLRTSVSTADLDQPALWGGELWFVERTVRVDWKDPESSPTQASLRHVRVADLSEAGPAVSLQDLADGSSVALLAAQDRLWLIGEKAAGYYADGVVHRLGGAARPARASRPFLYQGRPALVSLGPPAALATLEARAESAEWNAQELALGLPPEAGTLRKLQALETREGLHLFAELCTEEPEQCSVRHRPPIHAEWLPVVEDDCSCSSWQAIALGSQPGLVVSHRDRGRQGQLTLVELTGGAPRRRRLELSGKLWREWRAFPLEDRLLLASAGMPGSLTLTELAGGRVVRSVKRRGDAFPFGPHMMLFMAIPNLLPMVLSLVLALVLTGQMRKHRVADFACEGARRAFASLWQRAVAQLVDAVPLAAGFVLPWLWTWRLFSDPEALLEEGPLTFFVSIIATLAAALVSGLLVLFVYSYLEGRFGKTPGKWLLRIRVLGTDLRPCGFGRALLRNLLTFVDGFFNFLVGVLLVALTENWQRLGDLAARTIVVTDSE